MTTQMSQFWTFSLKQLADASAKDFGFCIACGYDQDSVEGHQRGLRCDSCDSPSVHGTEALMQMGRAR